MSSPINSYTLVSSGNGLTVSTDTDRARPRTPEGLIVTTCAQTKAGWVGQIIVDKEIVWEGQAWSGSGGSGDAIDHANRTLVHVIKQLFAGLTSGGG
jgi:hypothetical protein